MTAKGYLTKSTRRHTSNDVYDNFMAGLIIVMSQEAADKPGWQAKFIQRILIWTSEKRKQICFILPRL